MTTIKGDVIERAVRKKIGISELSRKLQVSRTAIYNWFEYGHVNLETICKIGKAIDYDFTKEFPEEFANAQNLNGMDVPVAAENQDEDIHDIVNHWMTKYIDLLEKYNALLVDLSYTNSKPNLQHINPEPSNHFGIR